jgi:acrylyl-CoA reductase (NADPH)
MIKKTFKALWVQEDNKGIFSRSVEEKTLDVLPDNEVLIAVKYSALNYKDALSAIGHKGVTKQYPHIPGIDAAGIVIEDKSGKFQKGEEVIVTSYDLGMNTFGGFSEYIRVPSAWVVSKPAGFDLKDSMILGTAGFTAALALLKMEQAGQNPEMGPVLVTGASGGVGSMAISILNKAGYKTVASTGKLEKAAYLKELGANEVIDRAEVYDTTSKPFLKTKWAGAIDTVGGVTLSTILKSCGLNANVATCGLVESANFSSTVYPFIIKGNNLLGIESATCAMETRVKIWDNLSSVWRVQFPKSGVRIIELSELNKSIDDILQGQLTGRVVVKF